MKKLAVITHVYNAAKATQEQVDSWAQIPHLKTSLMEFLIADDCSDEPLRLKSYGLPLRLFRIPTDIPWNMAGAKNLLHSQSTAEWLLFFDVDNRVEPNLLGLLAESVDRLNPKTIYLFPWILNGEVQAQPHINTFLIHRDALDVIGGFDEDFCGHYGYEDVIFHILLERLGFNRELLSDIPFVAYVAPTPGLSRDLTRNQKLGTEKIAMPQYPMGPKIRFEWYEVKTS